MTRSIQTDLRLIHREPGSAAVTATAYYGDAAASQAYVDTGSSRARTSYSTRIYLEAVKITANDELYTFQIQLCDSADFSTTDVVVAASAEVGANEVLTGSDRDSAAGDYILLHWANEYADTPYRYWRLAMIEDAGGTSPTITFNAATGPCVL